MPTCPDAEARDGDREHMNPGPGQLEVSCNPLLPVPGLRGHQTCFWLKLMCNGACHSASIWDWQEVSTGVSVLRCFLFVGWLGLFESLEIISY